MQKAHRPRHNLVQEPEVQPLVPLIRGRPDILVLLLGGPTVPDLSLALVSEDVPSLGEREEGQVADNDAEKDAVAPVVVRLVAWLVDVRGDQRSALHRHVVHRAGHGSSADRPRVHRGHRHENRMGVLSGQQQEARRSDSLHSQGKPEPD